MSGNLNVENMEKSAFGHNTPTAPRFAEDDVIHDESDDLSLENLPTASPEAVKFIDAIDEEAIEKFLFGDALTIVHNDTKKLVGEYRTCVRLVPPDNDVNEATVIVELRCNCQVGGVPSGITYVSRLSMKRLQLYEEQRRYDVEIGKDVLHHATEIARKDEHYVITRTTSKGHTALDKRIQKVENIDLETYGICEIVLSRNHKQLTWHYYFTTDGRLVSRRLLDGPVSEILLKLPPRIDRAEEQRVDLPLIKKSLDWQQDLQLQSIHDDRKEELLADHAAYLSKTGELYDLLSDLMQQVLINKPDNVVDFSQQYFTPSSDGEANSNVAVCNDVTTSPS